MGQNKAHKHELRQAYDTPAARLVTATDRDQMGLLTPSARDVVVSMDGVQNLVGFGTIMDVVNGRLTGTDSIALREIDTQDGIEILAGRKALPGEAIIGIEAMDKLRLTGPTGFVQNSSGMQFPIVGMYRAPQSFDDLNAGALTAADGELFTWRVVTTDVSEVPRVSESLGALLVSPAGHAFIESGYEKLASAIVYPGLSSDNARILFPGILAAGAFFVAIVVFADVLVSRSDLGRRRALGRRHALGATRSMVTGLVVG